MKSVAELDYDYPYVLWHRKQHFADILSLLFLFGIKRHLIQLCNAVHKVCNICSEALFQVFKACFGVLNNIVQKRRADGICIHSKLNKYLGNSYRMGYIRLAGFALLVLMLISGKLVCGGYFGYVIVLVGRLYDLQQLFKGFCIFSHANNTISFLLCK